MKYIFKLYIILCSCLLLIGCQKDNDEITFEVDDSVTIEAPKLTFDNNLGKKIIQFTTSGNWTARVADSATSWCSIDKTNGQTGYNTIEISVIENETYDERNASITITCGKAQKIITITQKQKDALLIESNKIEVAEEGGYISLIVRSNISFNYEIDDKFSSWIHKAENGTRGLSSNQIELLIDTNEELSSREGMIYITAGEHFEKVTIYQEGAKPTIVISQKDFFVSSVGGEIKIEVKSNTEYEYILPELDWLSEPQTRAVSSYTHYFIVAENSTYDSRYAEIRFINKTTNEIEIVKVTQMQKNAIIVAKNTYYIKSEETVIDLLINTNVDFETKISDNWIHSYEKASTRALVENQISFRVDKNLTTEERSANISFVYGEIIQTVNIVQDGRADKMKIAITHYETDFSAIEFVGNNISGTVDWGDGSKTDLTNGHSFGNTNIKLSNFETMGVNQFRIKSLNSISSITIYCNEGKNGSTEDFNIENKDWD